MGPLWCPNQAHLLSLSRTRLVCLDELCRRWCQVVSSYAARLFSPTPCEGAIANESSLDGAHIGDIEIEAEYSLIDLLAGMPKNIFMDLKKVRICGQAMNISLHGEAKAPRKGKGKPSPKGKPKGKSKKRGKLKPAPRNKKPKKRSK